MNVTTAKDRMVDLQRAVSGVKDEEARGLLECAINRMSEKEGEVLGGECTDIDFLHELDTVAEQTAVDRSVLTKARLVFARWLFGVV